MVRIYIHTYIYEKLLKWPLDGQKNIISRHVIKSLKKGLFHDLFLEFFTLITEEHQEWIQHD